MPAQAPEQAEGGVHYLLLDTQVRVDRDERVTYRHVASQALNPQGVESIANIGIRFDPSYERLTIHAIRVRRGAQISSRLNPASVRLLQRETALDALIYDGSKTASVFLEDVRVGDVVEFAYSLRGHNPVFGGRHFGQFDLEWSVPVAEAQARLVMPTARPVALTMRNGAPQPAVRESNGQREYSWQVHKVPARLVERDAPATFDPMASVQWSEFADWASVVRWGLSLYATPSNPAPAVAAVAEHIAKMHDAPDQRLLAALRFVQGEVRYLGFEIGTASHAPSAPERVLERRFGDCKDKTLLMLALLRALGIEAHAGLVHTGVREAIGQWQPSPGVFNHVLVRASLGGTHYWLDATRRPQAGSVQTVVQGDFGLALLLAPGIDRLLPMAGERSRLMRREVHTEIDSSAGVGQPVRYTVRTVAYGASAEVLRDALAVQSRERLQKDYASYYSQYFEGLSVESPFEVSDDQQANRLSVVERYRIAGFWSRSEKFSRSEGALVVPDLSEYLRQPASQVRRSPMALAYPLDLTQITTVKLPRPWGVKPDQVAIDDPAFEVRRSESWNGPVLVLSDRFTTKVSQLEASELPRYVANLEKARQALGYTLYDYDAKVTRMPHALPAVLALLSLIGVALLAWRLYRWDPPPREDPQRLSYGPRGLGGWLVVAALALVASVIRVSKMLWESLPAYTAAYWDLAVLPGAPEYDPLILPVLVLALVGNLGLVVGALLALVLWFRRRTSLPKVFVGLMVGSLVLVVADSALTELSATLKAEGGPSWGELVRTALATAAWAAYFHRSDRVRNTFVRRLHPATVATRLPDANTPELSRPD